MTTVRQRLRKHLSPLAADTVTTLNLPPVRMGLLTKLNLLTVGLIALTAVAVTAFFAWQEWRDVQQQIRAQGRVVLTMLADLSAPGLAAQDKAQIERTLSSLASDGDIAYVAVNDASGQPFAERRFSEKLQGSLPALVVDAASPEGATRGTERSIGGTRYAELVKPVIANAGGPPIGFVQVGLSFDRQQKNFRAQVL